MADIPAVLRWFRRWRFVRAYRVLRNEAERHRAAGHDVEFTAVNEAHLTLICRGCPDFAREVGGDRG